MAKKKDVQSNFNKKYKNLPLSQLFNKEIISIEDLYDLKPIEFERLCAKILQNRGFDHVIVSASSHDHGIDIFADYEDKKCDKNKTSWVESSVVRELIGSIQSKYWKYTHKMIISTSCYGPDAIETAKNNNVELIGIPRKKNKYVLNIMDIIRISGIFGDTQIIDPDFF